jgi:hypothetical protein
VRVGAGVSVGISAGRDAKIVGVGGRIAAGMGDSMGVAGGVGEQAASRISVTAITGRIFRMAEFYCFLQ